MTDTPFARLYDCVTVHRRETPFVRAFSYRLSFLDVDVDRLDEAAKVTGFGLDRPGLLSLRGRDVGPKTRTGDWRGWVEEALARAGVSLDGGAVRLVVLPRMLGYAFRPISFWFGFGPSGELRGVVYEVNNTFGDSHSYASAAAPPPRGADRHGADKQMYVSPFFDVDGAYRFTLAPPGEKLSVVIENYVDGARTHVASLVGRAQPFTTAAIARAFFGRPAQSHGVTAAIHWEALWLWLKGAGYRSKPHGPHAGFSVGGTPPASAPFEKRAVFGDASNAA